MQESVSASTPRTMVLGIYRGLEDDKKTGVSVAKDIRKEVRHRESSSNVALPSLGLNPGPAVP